ncbi:MAG: hypothetical protein ABJV68_06820 [Paracoccaceae bacterium]
MSIEVHTFIWNGIEIELLYFPNKWNVVAHLEVRSIAPKNAPLPITETGYLSHHHPIGTVEAAEGTLVEQVTAWLDDKAKSKAWQCHVEVSRQGSLVDLL